MKFIEKNNISNKLISSLSESKAWSAEELDAASKVMKAQGHMSYEEFCKELKLAKQGKSKKIKIINNDNKREIKEDNNKTSENTIIKLKDYKHKDFDENIKNVEIYYDRHYKMYVVSAYNKDGFIIGDSIWVFSKKEALDTKKELLAKI